MESIPDLFTGLSIKENGAEEGNGTKPSSCNSTHAVTKADIRSVPHFPKVDESLKGANDTTTTSNSSRTRRDSTTEFSELDALKFQIQQIEQQNRMLKEEAETYKTSLEKSRSENDRMQQEMECIAHEIRQIQFLLGTGDITFDKISYKKIEKPDCSTDVNIEAEFKIVLSKDLNLPPKEYRKKGGIFCREHDKGAIACVWIFGRLYAAKCGKRQNGMTFIDKEIWTNKVISLSEVICEPREWGWAQHAELQLIAFYLAEVFEGTGFKVTDIKNPKAYKKHPELLHSVRVYVDQPVCESCEPFIKGVNEITGRYGLKFSVTGSRES